MARKPAPRKAARRAKPASDLLLRMELATQDTCDAMAALSECLLGDDEVKRLRVVCDAMLEVRRAIYRFAIQQDDRLSGIKSRPGREFIRTSAIVTARNPRDIRRGRVAAR